MTEAEFKAFRGYNIGMSRLSTAPQMTPKLVSGGANTTVDWRKIPGVLTPVKNQGSCGSCWAFSTTESIESDVALELKKAAPILSPQDVVSCTPNPDHCGGTGGCNGATAELGISYVAASGICLESQWPYTATTGSCTNASAQHAPAYKVSGYVKLTTNSYDALYNALNLQPISVSVDASTWSVYKSGVFNCTSSTLDIDHAVQAVGYGHDATSNLDYWIVRNSWGVSWGEQGYIRLLRHSDGSSNWCWDDPTSQDGSACDGDPSDTTVCGTCGIWYDNCYPYGASTM